MMASIQLETKSLKYNLQICSCLILSFHNLMANNLPALAGQIPYPTGQLQDQRVAVINSFDIQSLTVTDDANLGLLKAQVEVYQQVSQSFKNALNHEIRCRQIRAMTFNQLSALGIPRLKNLLEEFSFIKKSYEFHDLDGVYDRFVIMQKNRNSKALAVAVYVMQLFLPRRIHQSEKRKQKSQILESQEQSMKPLSTTCSKQQNSYKQWRKKNE